MKFRHPILAPVLCFLLLITACGPHPRVAGPPQHADSERALFLRAERDFRSRSYEQALSRYNTYLSRYPKGRWAPDALMQEAEIYRYREDAATARKLYGYLIDQFPGHSRAGDARAEILATYYDEGAYKEVIRQADGFLRQSRNGAQQSGIYLTLGNTYLAMDSPINAVYFYAKADEQSQGPAEEGLSEKIKEAVRGLSTADIMSLLERVRDPFTRGYLMYYQGVQEIDEERFEDGIRTLTQFANLYPGHAYGDEAEELINEVQTRYALGSFSRRSVGCLLPLTGAYQVYGNRALHGVQLAMEESGAEGEITLVVKDTGSNSGEAVARVGEMAREGVSAILGPIATADSAAITAQELGIPIITLTQKSEITRLGDFVFRNFLTPGMQARTLAAYAVNTLAMDRLAVLYPDEKYGTTFMNLFWKEAAALGAAVTAVEAYDTELTDFAGPIRRLASQDDFQALFIPDGPSKTGLIVPQLAFYEVTGIQLLGTNLWHSEELLKMAGKFVQGAVLTEVFFENSESPRVRQFVDAFTRRYGEAPGFIEALAYDSARILLEIFEGAEFGSPTAIRNALMRFDGFQGVTGLTAFDQSGEAHKTLSLLQIEGGHFAELPVSPVPLWQRPPQENRPLPMSPPPGQAEENRYPSPAPQEEGAAPLPTDPGPTPSAEFGGLPTLSDQ